MRITGITSAELAANAGLTSIILAKLFNTREWGEEDFTHAEYQWLFDNDKDVDLADLYSPELSTAAMSNDVPANWPDSTITDGETTRLKTWFEYCQYFATTNGDYIVKFADGAKDTNNNITRPSASQLRIWISTAGGFLTRSEALALRAGGEW